MEAATVPAVITQKPIHPTNRCLSDNVPDVLLIAAI